MGNARPSKLVGHITCDKYMVTGSPHNPTKCNPAPTLDIKKYNFLAITQVDARKLAMHINSIPPMVERIVSVTRCNLLAVFNALNCPSMLTK
jgi:hypothetical protein